MNATNKSTLLDKIYPQKTYNVNGKIIKKPRNKTIYYSSADYFYWIIIFIPTRNITIKFEQPSECKRCLVQLLVRQRVGQDGFYI